MPPGAVPAFPPLFFFFCFLCFFFLLRFCFRFVFVAASLFLFVFIPAPSPLLFCEFRFYFLWQFRPASLHLHTPLLFKEFPLLLPLAVPPCISPSPHPPYITYNDAQPLRYVTLSRRPPCRGGWRRFLYGWLLSLSLAGDWTELLIGPSLLLPPGPPSSNCHSANMAKHACSCPCHLPVGRFFLRAGRLLIKPVRWSTACTTDRTPSSRSSFN